WLNLGILQSLTGKFGEALESYAQALKIQQSLSKAHPEVTRYQASLAYTWNSLGLLQRHTGTPEEARKCFEQARDVLLRLSKAHPEVPDYQADLAGTWVNLGNVQMETGKPEETLKSVNQAVALLVAVRKREPAHPSYRLFLRNAHWVRAQALGQLGRHGEAVADWDEVLRLNTTPVDRSFFRLPRADTRARAGDYRRAMSEAGELAGEKSLSGVTLYNLACVVALSAASVA